jgi:hypothetical protein
MLITLYICNNIVPRVTWDIKDTRNQKKEEKKHIPS